MSDNFLTNLKFTSIILFFLGGIAAFINWLGTSNGWWDSNAGIFPILFTVGGGLLTITLSMIEQHRINKSLNKLKDKFDDFSDNLAFDIKTDISSVVSTIGNTASIIDTKEKRVYLNGIYENFKRALVNISIGKVEENDPDKYHQFAINTFNLVKEKGEIIASSTIDPNGFWSEADINRYLSNNKSLIEERQITFKRYFFIPNDAAQKESSKIPIARNINIGAEVFVIDVQKHKLENSPLYFDGGRIDNTIAIKSVTSNGHIKKVKGYFRGVSSNEYLELVELIEQWSEMSENAYSYYNMTKQDFLDLI
jgi:hypothetical protein